LENDRALHNRRHPCPTHPFFGLRTVVGRKFLVANLSRQSFLRDLSNPALAAPTNESAARLEAFDTSEDISSHIRDVIGEPVAGRSLEFANLESCAAFATREPLIKARLGGDLHEALLALRAMQGDVVVDHSKSLTARF
jgi:hypothetical protein